MYPSSARAGRFLFTTEIRRSCIRELRARNNEMIKPSRRCVTARDGRDDAGARGGDRRRRHSRACVVRDRLKITDVS